MKPIHVLTIAILLLCITLELINVVNELRALRHSLEQASAPCDCAAVPEPKDARWWL